MYKELTTYAEIKGFLREYNFFHDALLQVVKFTSSDRFQGKAQSLSITDQFKAELTICHYNYLANKDRKVRRFYLELSGLGNFSFSSPGGRSPARHLALTRIEFAAAKGLPGMWLMCIWGNRYDAAGGKWKKAKLAEIQFLKLVVKLGC